MKRNSRPIKGGKPNGKKMRAAQLLHAKGKMTARRFKAFKDGNRQSRLKFF